MIICFCWTKDPPHSEKRHERRVLRTSLARGPHFTSRLGRQAPPSVVVSLSQMRAVLQALASIVITSLKPKAYYFT